MQSIGIEPRISSKTYPPPLVFSIAINLDLNWMAGRIQSARTKYIDWMAGRMQSARTKYIDLESSNVFIQIGQIVFD
jgi:hypothetical protein